MQAYFFDIRFQGGTYCFPELLLALYFKKNFVYCDTSKWRAVTFGQEEKNEEEEKTLLSGKNERQQNYLKDPYIGRNHLGFFSWQGPSINIKKNL